MRKKLPLLIFLMLSLVARSQQTWQNEIRERLDRLMQDELLETAQMGMMVWDLTVDSLFYQHKPHYLMRTASTMKALTAIAALDRLGGDYQLSTSLYYKGTLSGGMLTGDLICVGGMDPLFDGSDMAAFAQALRRMGVSAFRGRIVSDCSMKDDDKWGEGWCWDDDNPILSPLLISTKDDFPEQLQKHMRQAGISLSSVTLAQGALPNDARLVCTRRHPVQQLLHQMMKESDNLFAECLYYQLAASTGRRPATAKDAREVEVTLFGKMGVDGSRYRLADGSGLSLYNYLSPECETMLMRYAWQHQNIYTHLLPSLPIAGIDGTLKKRMKGTFAEGNVRAKTGTVTGVSTLTGYLTASNGHLLSFTIMTQGLLRAAEGRQFQDRVCVALASPLDVEMEIIWQQLEENE